MEAIGYAIRRMTITTTPINTYFIIAFLSLFYIAYFLYFPAFDNYRGYGTETYNVVLVFQIVFCVSSLLLGMFYWLVGFKTKWLTVAIEFAVVIMYILIEFLSFYGSFSIILFPVWLGAIAVIWLSFDLTTEMTKTSFFYALSAFILISSINQFGNLDSCTLYHPFGSGACMAEGFVAFLMFFFLAIPSIIVHFVTCFKFKKNGYYHL